MFVLTRESSLSPGQVWQRLASMADHTAAVPLTVTVTDPGEPEVGWTFLVRTSLGPLHFDDPMVVQEWDPPRGWRIRKNGPLRGWAAAVVQPYAGGSRLTWTEEIWVGSGLLQRVSRAVADRVGPLVFAPVVDRIVGAGGAR